MRCDLEEIVIVGGGSSGWMTAALLSKKLPSTHITLIEASDIPIVGVGESTNLTIRYFLGELGFRADDERQFMQACNASFKMAIRFENFNSVGGVFYHPFGRPKPRTRVVDFEPGAQAVAESFSAIQIGNAFSPRYAYSYQIDAGLFATYLKETSKKAPNLRHIVDRVKRVTLSENGAIDYLELEKTGRIAGTLFVDCTGFRSALLGDTLKEPFESCGGLLLNDRAVTVRVPYVDKEVELVTHTNCTALSAGWVWNIPLWSRKGMGYVYSSSYLSETEAESELRQHLGEERSSKLNFGQLKIRTGRHTRAWVKNCVAIGISYGFLEPLESTGLSLTQIAIRDLWMALDSGLSLVHEREMFNRRQGQLFDSTRDFILAHYVLTSREDTPYWRHVRHNIAIPDSLTSILAGARAKSWHTVCEHPHTFYTKDSWNCILSGMGFFGKDNAMTRKLSGKKHTTLSQALQEHIYGDTEAVRTMPAVEEDARSHPTWYPTL